MKFSMTDGVLTMGLANEVDSSNVSLIEQKINSVLAENPAENVVIDLEELAYISSAGLRMVLRLRKNYPDMKMINASSEVYEILEMTGFTEMIPVSKAYRRLSVDGCEVIGQGANGKVYRLDPDTVIKVYMNPDSLPDIQRERELARKAFVMGIPTAIPYDVVRVDESYGSVFELLNAKSLAKILIEDPDRLDECARTSVELLKKIHATELKPGDMPDEKAVALGWAEFLKDHLPADQYDKLHGLIAAIPEDHHMMHGDYHVKNVMIQNGETLLIDMDTLCLGHPVFEFASIFAAYLGYGEVDHDVVSKFFGFPFDTSAELMRRIFCYYFDLHDEAAYQEHLDKARVIGYTRMMRRAIRRHGEPAFIEHCREQLAMLLARVDTLLF